MLFTPSSSAAIALIYTPPAPFDIRLSSTKFESLKKKIDSSSKPYPPESAPLLSIELLPLKTHNRDVSKLSVPSSVNPSGSSREEVDLASKLRSCFTEKDVRRLHTFVYKHPQNYLSTYVGNNLISSYARLGKLIEARKVFDEMSLKNVVSWTAILNAYLSFGLDIEALSVFRDFVASGIQPNCKTFVCAMNLCSSRLDYELGKQIHASIIKSKVNNLVVDSAIVYFYAQCCDLSSASCVFDRMPAYDVISWTTMITAYSQQGLGNKAFSVFTRMVSEGYVANEFTVCSVLNACGDEEAIGLGKQLHGAIVKKTVKNDVFIGTSLVDMYAKCGDIVNCRKVFDGMINRNTVTWTAIIAGYARNGYGEEAVNLFRIMRRRNLFVNNLTMVSILKACGSVRALMLGKEVHAQLLKKFGQFDIYIGSSLVWMYCKCDKSSIASNVLQQMPLKDVVSWTTMISGCCAHLGHESEALEFLKEMLGEGMEPNHFTYSSALKACARLENVEQGRLIHCSVKKTAAMSNVFVASALIFMYTKCGYVSDAVQVFDSMPERNLVAWKAMIVGYARNGLCQEALKLLYRMKEEGVKIDDCVHMEVLAACGNYYPMASRQVLDQDVNVP
ncbi:pentatricopeptide repeat-containing protein At4g18520, chloroplastic-like [Impatiens glandulifera]|uniref:pentatricopeptide repeat-containing protein At4g18520, chloroplastic-like n=1 Tax=Impatiens glandulifera TaxID=253017 RepID=UPI001FB06F66|nr:pentatricopeptide repeat-containing protein At4g18520, chloroplastic-like [Impatiens glandulifera]